MFSRGKGYTAMHRIHINWLNVALGTLMTCIVVLCVCGTVLSVAATYAMLVGGCK